VIVIEVYADIWCPFTHVGLRSVLRRRHQLGRDDVVVRVRAWPLELVNGKPLDRPSVEKHVHDLRMQVAPDLFAGFDADNLPLTSLPALAVAAAAYRQDERTGEAVSVALRDALFEEGLDISHPAVLTDVATAHGVGDIRPEDDRAVLVDWHDGQLRGVQGSPHFFCGEADVFCPSLDISKDEEGHLRLRRNIEALDAFLATCFKT
jgi:predicted DsbA family dithiol-disulfide isomerase